MTLKDERLRIIVNRVRDNGKATVIELSEYFDVSDITIRRDLKELAEKGLIRREHGGAVYPVDMPEEPPVIQRMFQNRPNKERIARATAALIKDNESVFIGSGSTATYVVRHLTNRQNLTVITNAVNIAHELASSEGITVVVLGGMMRASELSMVGHITEQALQEVRMDKVIIGVKALSVKAGITNDFLPEVMTDRKILEMGSELIVVADYTKLGKASSAYVAPVNRITTLVTDRQADPQIVEELRALGVQVVVT
ncbi:MAG: DeoR/GlpR family DNA-binding transcription regulator [Anaerolineae bacterium]|nr:DeoR/GlpR family DNA-binding transcription regulator [Anaerolineae bacterium]